MMQINKHFPAERHTVLANGLRVHLVPRPDFHQMAANLTVDFGGRDDTFQWQQQTIHQPLGVAHFLEHRMFGQPDYDAFQKLSELGADANAFTSQSRTSYYFTSLANNLAALNELLHFTQTAYFPEDAVKREAQIIAQEADMYQDNVDARLYRMLLGQLYPGDLLSEEIVGTHASLSQITGDMLQTAFEAFYQPANMDIFITGAFDVEAALATIEQSTAGQRGAHSAAKVVTPKLAEPLTTPKIVTLPTNRTKVALGRRWRTPETLPTGRAGLKEMIGVSLALDLVFGELSPQYMEWYDTGIIGDDFSVEFEWERGFAFITVATDTPEPETVITEIKAVLDRFADAFAQLQDEFDLVKKDAMGRAVNRFNFMEEDAVSFEGKLFDASTVMDEYSILEEIDVAFVQSVLVQNPLLEISSIIVHPNLGLI
ncbi:insulinase family protein [Weissella viridescens]|uniref:Insulinase family protein n=1 Tax=Weissella viridescens TaxID=1629 RepID=A0A3P2RFA5_WEIVI|nr:pitrilysin family protein [Weissella viridescens]RRG17911.1 insulinase family protein [Weissella viridescens]